MKRILNIFEIQKVLPHGIPFIFIEKVIELEPGKKATGIKNVAINEWFFQGHVSGYPLMPGVLMIEAATQLISIVLYTSKEFKDIKGLPFHFGGVKEFRFYKEVIPGDTLKVEVELIERKKRLFTFQVTETVEDNMVSAGQINMVLLKEAKVF